MIYFVLLIDFVMKAKLFLFLVLSVLSTQVDAQDLLRRIGRSVGKSVQREIVKKAREKSASQRCHVQTQPSFREQVEPQQVAPQPQAVVMQASDTGQNIVRDTTLNYIDEYGQNKFSVSSTRSVAVAKAKRGSPLRP